MFESIRNMWALFFGVSILWLGAGMSYTLIIVRANAEGFSDLMLGIIQTSYQLGWLVATFISPKLIKQVGHVRVFGAMTAASSALIILHLLWINPLIWSLERFLAGICTAVLMVVSESWLNDMSDNKNRGKMLGFYTFLSWGFPVAGIWLLGFGDINSFLYFVIASVCISVAVVPMLLSVSRTPSFIELDRLPFKELFKISPLGVVGAFLSGTCHGILYATVAIYGNLQGMSAHQVINLNAITLLGGLVFIWPIALLSDTFNRRWIILLVSLTGAVSGAYFAFEPDKSVATIYFGAAIMSGSALSLYSLSVSHANDFLSAKNIVPASSTLILLYGIGYAIAPAALSPVLSYWNGIFFVAAGIVMLLLAAYTLYNMTQRKSVVDPADTLTLSSSSPYASVAAVAEEWGEDISTEQGSYDKITETH